ncbi:MAG: Ig-like domain-containing protein [Leuconostoc pseudomesenteroides]|uniref:Ig-like domain-containing protein n=1 Tax=Leuconostoc pseudomesenteroides TaxID=33968 RepID=UPI0039ECCBB1
MAENNLNVMADLGTIKSIDFVNQFGTSINDLLTLLGVTRKEPMTADMQINLYKWAVDMDTAATVGEGETIPLSKVTRALDRTVKVEWLKKRRAVSAEAVARHGANIAIDQADKRLMREIQSGVKTDFVSSLGETKTKIDSNDLQVALSQSWGKLQLIPEFEGESFVSFVNPMDVANFMSGKPIQADASNAYGMTLLQNFIGADRVIGLGSIPQGKVYTTAVDNIVLAYLDMANSPLKGSFVDYTDETGLLAVVSDKTVSNLTLESVFTGAFKLFAEIPDGVIEATLVGDNISVTGVTMSQKTATIKVGDSRQVTGTVAPENASDKSVTYASSDETVATVAQDGTITAVKVGTADVTVTTKDGGKSDKVVVTVTAAS